MSNPPTPSGYDRSYSVNCHTQLNCQITVGIDIHAGDVVRFVVRLHYSPPEDPGQWETIARFDHNPNPRAGAGVGGHNIYDEGLHIDVEPPSGTQKIHPSHGPIPRDGGVVVRSCVQYLQQQAQYFVDVFKGNTHPGSSPGWP